MEEFSLWAALSSCGHQAVGNFIFPAIKRELVKINRKTGDVIDPHKKRVLPLKRKGKEDGQTKKENTSSAAAGR